MPRVTPAAAHFSTWAKEAFLRTLAIVLFLLIAALQYPMWLGKGGWLKVRELDRQLDAARQTTSTLKARNERLDADVRDLKTGVEAIEERARFDLGMMRQEEVFFQLQSPRAVNAAAALPNKGGFGSGNANAAGAGRSDSSDIAAQSSPP